MTIFMMLQWNVNEKLENKSRAYSSSYCRLCAEAIISSSSVLVVTSTDIGTISLVENDSNLYNFNHMFEQPVSHLINDDTTVETVHVPQ